MPARALADFLDNNGVNYHCYNHAPAVTASEVAQSAHIPGRHMAKTVIGLIFSNLTLPSALGIIVTSPT